MDDAEQNRPTIIWFRNDLRLADNPALARAASSRRPLIALHVLDDCYLGGATRWWLHHSLAKLGERLAGHGVPLILRRGPAREEVISLALETRAANVFWNRRYDPHGIAADSDLKEKLRAAGLVVESFNSNLITEPWEVKTSSGGPFRVFTPFWKALRAHYVPAKPISEPSTLEGSTASIPSLRLEDMDLLPRKPDWANGLRGTWCPGEAGARDRLQRFLADGFAQYADCRDFPAAGATSMLSPHLRFGEISPRRIWHAASLAAARRDIPEGNLDKFLSELAWREFSYHLLFHNPDLPRENFQRKFDAFPWANNEAAFRAWTKGRTGYPIVDAGMRELWQTGTMHNRVRMIAASFLIKHLLVDWRKGAEWFRDTLVDADIASNSASWQWVAGSGADAAPYFRIFNPVLQGEKFDPDGSYTRRFVPELAGLPDRYLFRPFEAPESVLAKAGVTLGKTYPSPIVDHGLARDRALQAFQTLSAAA
ncbi:deoxyribodipyrimidine photo-lyase [Stappia sp. F7233]|uniref:Deoxyribodipyrimidine photo-lyase n=1 Tax=Stappia albiluteola TaxID=2758565 RepID=A0A839AAK0_9HYPH|nr:deoxyribodipyrimidine photo-lyase [Stappia albiluteola]MBA5776441.1 deoxyribodipyrimidine photo-lyase [Stappia albiluteola]